jgi:hypothetical protein
VICNPRGYDGYEDSAVNFKLKYFDVWLLPWPSVSLIIGQGFFIGVSIWKNDGC